MRHINNALTLDIEIRKTDAYSNFESNFDSKSQKRFGVSQFILLKKLNA